MEYIEQLILDENHIAFHPMMGNTYQLNEIGKEIIVMLKQHKTQDEILKELLFLYDVSLNELYIDLHDFFSKLKVYGLLK